MAKAKAVKVENYSAELTAQIKAQYVEGMPVDEIAKIAGKTPRSIVAKLSRENVWVKKTYKAKDGSDVETKAVLVEKIAKALGVSSDVVGSLEAGTKAALKLVYSALADTNNAEGEAA